MFFFFNDTATTEIYTLSLHDALPISPRVPSALWYHDSSIGSPRRYSGPPFTSRSAGTALAERGALVREDRKSTRLNSSHSQISYAVFCLKKKKSKNYITLLIVTRFYE